MSFILLHYTTCVCALMELGVLRLPIRFPVIISKDIPIARRYHLEGSRVQLGRFTWDALSLSRGLAACLLVLIILVAARLFGQSGIIAALAALLALLGTVGWHGAARLHMIAAFTLSGALLSLLASLLATYGGIWSTLPLVFLVVAGGGLLYGAGSREAYAGLQLGVAMLAVLALADSIAIWQPALSFLVGGGLVFLLFLLRLITEAGSAGFNARRRVGVSALSAAPALCSR